MERLAPDDFRVRLKLKALLDGAHKASLFSTFLSIVRSSTALSSGATSSNDEYGEPSKAPHPVASEHAKVSGPCHLHRT